MLRFFRMVFAQPALKSDFSPRFKIVVNGYVGRLLGQKMPELAARTIVQVPWMK